MESKIIDEIRTAKYFSYSVDSTPDVSHIDQLVFCLRYVIDGAPIERFLGFIPIKEHTSEYLSNTVVNYFKEKKIDIMDCRGQSHDTTASMSGCYSGLQARITSINEFATYVPCAAHSLNLVGKNTIDADAEANDFFDLVERLYGFFVHSTSRWDKLKTTLHGTNVPLLKRATGTRWSSKNDAVIALDSSYAKIVGLLKSFLDKKELNALNQITAKGIINKLCQFKNIFMLKMWKIILSQFNRVNVKLQSKNLNLSVASKLHYRRKV